MKASGQPKANASASRTTPAAKGSPALRRRPPSVAKATPRPRSSSPTERRSVAEVQTQLKPATKAAAKAKAEAKAKEAKAAKEAAAKEATGQEAAAAKAKSAKEAKEISDGEEKPEKESGNETVVTVSGDPLAEAVEVAAFTETKAPAETQAVDVPNKADIDVPSVPKERLVSAPPRVAEARVASPPPPMTLEALYAENSRLKQELERQRAEIQELRSQGIARTQTVVHEPRATYIVTAGSRSSTPAKARCGTYSVPVPCRSPAVAAGICPYPVQSRAALSPRADKLACKTLHMFGKNPSPG
ncbi:unnamed protein product [Effrenium voratum]|uniref:Uncharacterized protein n=1 Tax=Effrenium voratum TaxID=2562239 RepID=A0AA36NBS2_9DINO|nr:unnamed protein product [Effrenium voratum]